MIILCSHCGYVVYVCLFGLHVHVIVYNGSMVCICDRLRENRAQRGVRKYREKIDRFIKNVLFQADGRERLGLL